MATTVKYKSRTRELTANGWVDVIVHQGAKADVDDFAAAHYINEPGENGGYLKTVRVLQDEADIWNCELRYEQGTDGGFVQSPPTAYGKKSATLRGSMLSLPLSKVDGYRTNWDHYLFARPGQTGVPAFWATATTEELTGDDSKNYRWGSTLAECPLNWQTLKKPQKQGYDHVDYPTYSVTESARFSSAEAAGTFVANKLNRIGSPSNTFGITGGDWKCDDASTQWTGKYWLATLSWTRSGDNRGWDRDLYKPVGGN